MYFEVEPAAGFETIPGNRKKQIALPDSMATLMRLLALLEKDRTWITSFEET